jgi:kynurenine formamidase
MKVQLQHQGQSHTVDLNQGLDCSSTYGLAAAEPRAWYANPVKTEPVRQGDWVGEVKQGAPVNFFDVHLNPHGNGTHTECVGHISPQQQSINQVLPGYHGIAHFCRLAPDTHAGKMVSLKAFEALNLTLDFEVLIIEVPVAFPQDFSGTNPPYFEPALLVFLRQQGIKHFITNLPSVDPEEDAGALAAHKAFWNYPAETDLERTITELAYFPPQLKPGAYFLNLQVAPLNNDASPSRPVLYTLD